CLGVGVRVALLLLGTEAPVVPLADRLDGRRQREDLGVALLVLATAAAGVEEPPVAGTVAAVARVLARGQRSGAVLIRRQAGPGAQPAHELGLLWHLADPVLLEALASVALQRVGVLAGF